MSDLHWHGVPSQLRQPDTCCVDALERANAEAVHAERRRVVLSALDSIEAYWSAIASVLPVDDPGPKLAKAVLEQCINAVRQAGCICPMLDVTQLNDRYPRQVPGGDARCGLHGVRPGLSRESNPASAERPTDE